MLSRWLKTNNPIFRRERAYYAGALAGMRWPTLFLLPSLTLAVLAVNLFWYDSYYFSFPTELWFAWIFHAGVSIFAIIESANAVSREYTEQTWEALILTGISAQQILFGKFRAVFYRLKWWTLGLIVIRLEIMILLTLRIRGGYPTIFPGSWGLILIALIAMPLISLLEVACCAALSLAASALIRHRAGAMALALAIRFTPVILFGFAVVTNASANGNMLILYTQFGLADGATVPNILLMLGSKLDPQLQLVALPALLLSAGFLVGILLVSLFSALNLLRQNGASGEHPRFRSSERFSNVI
jgi:ABC-type transport system involved in multi-copper enzyme maturation permease subunit